jgi:hypothetical protein
MEVTEYNLGTLDLSYTEKEVVGKLIRQGYIIKKPQDLPRHLKCQECNREIGQGSHLCWYCQDKINDAYDFP